MKEPKGEGKYNVVVIGAGTAGLVTAAGTAGLGGRVALIERNKMGGDCLNFGCVPSKALISSARLDRKHPARTRLGSRKTGTAVRVRKNLRADAGAPGENRAERFAGTFRVAGRGCLSRRSAVRVTTRTPGRRSKIAREEFRHRDRNPRDRSENRGHRDGAVFHQRNDFRRAERKTGKHDRDRRRTDRVRAGAGAEPVGREDHDRATRRATASSGGSRRGGVHAATSRGGGNRRAPERHIDPRLGPQRESGSRISRRRSAHRRALVNFGRKDSESARAQPRSGRRRVPTSTG